MFVGRAEILLFIFTTFSCLQTYCTIQYAVPGRCPGQEVQQIRREAAEHELSLVFYYVSWCRKSREIKLLYDEVALYFHEEAYFAAVDCWHLACNCSRVDRSERASPDKWPTLFVHYGANISMKYNGEWLFESLVNYLRALFQPIDRVDSKQDLKTLLARCSSVVLGLFSTVHAIEYHSFAQAAVKWLEVDPERNLRYAIAFNSSTERILKGINVSAPVIMFINEDRLDIINSTKKLKSRQLLLKMKFELKPHRSHANSYNPAQTLSVYLTKNPVLAIFVNDLDFNNNFFTIMEDDNGIFDSVRKQHTFCQSFWQRTDDERNNIKSLRSQFHCIDTKNQLTMCHKKEYLNSQSLYEYYLINNCYNSFFETFSVTKNQETEISEKLLLDLHQYHKCLTHPNFITPEVKIAASKTIKKEAEILWMKASARPNATLAVVIFETEQHKDYLNMLGITTTALSAATVFIADLNSESIFQMQELYSMDALLNFVQNYYEGDLQQITKDGEQFRKPPSPLNNVYLEDFNRQTFLNYMHRNNQTTVVLLYSPKCALTAVMSQTLMQISVMVDSDIIRFTRLNTDAVDLPWELVMPTIPTLMVIPRGLPKATKTFPPHFIVDVRNVLGFILAQLEPVEQIQIVLHLCREMRIPHRLQKCLQFARNLIATHIDNHLSMWQVYENQRSLLLSELRHFKDLSLQIQQL